MLLEIGPGRTLSSLSRQQVPAPTALPTLRHPQEVLSDARFAALTLGRLWLTGVPLDFERIRGAERRRRVPLPSYSFEPRRYWVARGSANAARSHKPGLLRKKPDIADWFGSAAWKRGATPAPEPVLGPWLIFSDQNGVGERLAALCAGEKVIQVMAGDTFMKVGQDRYTIRPDAAADYQALVDDLALRELFPTRWSTLGQSPSPRGAGRCARLLGKPARPTCFARWSWNSSVRFFSPKRWAPRTASSRYPSSPRACIRSPATARPNRKKRYCSVQHGSSHANFRPFGRARSTCRCATRPRRARPVADALRAELRARPVDGTVALRSTGRWVQSFEPLALGAPTETPIRQGGVYLITGGLGGIGLELAQHLARTAKAKLVLLGRTGLPARAEWQKAIAEGGAIAARLKKVQAIEAQGGEVLPVGGDVAVLDDMRAVANLIESVLARCTASSTPQASSMTV